MPEGTTTLMGEEEEEELLFDMQQMQAPEVPHVEMTTDHVP